MTYATDGKCHYAAPGTFGHECGKTAEWIATKSDGFRCGYCSACKPHAGPTDSWTPLPLIHALHYAFQHADNEWSAQLQKQFGKDCGTARYQTRGKGEAGSYLRYLSDRFDITGEAWRSTVLKGNVGTKAEC